MKAALTNYRQAPRKVRLVGDLIKGKSADDALVALSFLPKRAALPMKKLLESALANAKQKGVERGELMVSSVRVDKGVVLKRRLPRARGFATPINKRTSHVEILLAAKTESKKAKKAKMAEEKKETATKARTPKKKAAK